MRRSRAVVWLLAILALSLVISGIALLRVATDEAHAARERQQWQTLPGRLLEFTILRDPLLTRERYRALVRYQFQVNGREYTGETLAGRSWAGSPQALVEPWSAGLEPIPGNAWTALEPGQSRKLPPREGTLPVWFNPADPQQSVLGDPTLASTGHVEWMRLGGWGLAGLGAVLFVLLWVVSAGEHRQRAAWTSTASGHGAPTDAAIGEFQSLITQALAAVDEAMVRDRSLGFLASTAATLRGFQATPEDTLLHLERLGFSRQLSDEGSLEQQGPEGRRVMDRLTALERFHRRWRDQAELEG